MDYPNVVRNRMETFQERKSYVSVDFEYDPARPLVPTILGLSSGSQPHSSYYDRSCSRKLKELVEKGVTWAAHSFSADIPIIERETGARIPQEKIEDTMIRHYLNNAELCKGVVKGEEEEDTEPKSRGQGFMDLWSMASLYTDLPQWKQCRGQGFCEGPCRNHDQLGYNGTDAYAVDVALEGLKEDAKRKQIPQSLYDHILTMTFICEEMKFQGIKVNREYIAKLEKEFQEKKAGIFPSRMVRRIGKKGQELKTFDLVWDAPFNPRSPSQVINWFRDKGIYLESTQKADILSAMDDVDGKTDPQAAEWLGKLYDYKDAGKGLMPWFGEKYFGNPDGLMHPRFIPTGTSMGRLASADPNFQNMPRIGFGKQVRRGVEPRDGSLILAKADKSQLELRMCLYYAGITQELEGDAFTWLVQQGQGIFEEAAEIVGAGKSARDITKSVSHGGDYGEGVKVLYSRDLDSARTKRLIDCGALVVYRDWEYHGGVVAFTGVNLAERLFKSASWENRAKALKIQEAYFKRFSEIRAWQKRVSRAVELGYVRSASGRYLQLYGTPQEKLKIALAFYGQGGGADDVQEGMVRYYHQGNVPLIQVHDELVFEFPREITDKKLLEFFSVMSATSKMIPGFKCPVKVSRGENWLDMREIGKA